MTGGLLPRWQPEAIERLRTLWAGGFSATQIGREIGYTRNAVLGKVHRLGLVPRRDGQARGPKRIRQVRPVSVKRNVHKRPPVCVKLRNTGTNAQRVLREIAPSQAPLMLGLMQITDKNCRFPIGHPKEPDFGFCGHEPMVPGGYCAWHHALCYRPSEERRKAA